MKGINISPYIKKSFKLAILALLVFILLGFSCSFASDLEVEDPVSDQSSDSRVEQLLQEIAGKLPETPSNGQLEVEKYVTTDVQQLRISSGDTSGLHSLVLSLIGDYNPIVKDYVYQNQSGYQTHSIEITPDWSWIMTAGLFIIVLYCFFRLLGIVLGGK